MTMKINSNIPYHEALNPSQLEAVNFTEGPLLVIAGAGSGKTRALTYRVACFVEKGVAPGSILLLTFTRKASFEMLKRAALLLDNDAKKLRGEHSTSSPIRYCEDMHKKLGLIVTTLFPTVLIQKA